MKNYYINGLATRVCNRLKIHAPNNNDRLDVLTAELGYRNWDHYQANCNLETTQFLHQLAESPYAETLWAAYKAKKA